MQGNKEQATFANALWERIRRECTLPSEIHLSWHALTLNTSPRASYLPCLGPTCRPACGSHV